MGIKAQVSKWGHSLAVRLPKAVAEQMGVDEGSEIEIIARGDQVVLRKPSYTLAGLLEGVTEENLHAEVDPGEPVGGEAW